MSQKIGQAEPEYSLGEEIVNAVSHGIGAGLAVAGLILLVLKAQTTLATVSVCLYSACAIILFTVSCVYHALSPQLKRGKHILRTIDHCNVLNMVAGTYFPICLSLLGDPLGWTLFAVVLALTIPAVVLNAIDVNKYQVVSAFHSLILGWGILFFLGPIRAHCPDIAVNYLFLGGGALYTIGAVLYGIGSQKKWFHSIFHIFVLAGAILHWFFIYFYCI